MAGLPDFMTDPNAVLNDTEHEWRYGRVPDYKKVNAAYDLGKSLKNDDDKNDIDEFNSFFFGIQKKL
jgi:hypothetical protein